MSAVDEGGKQRIATQVLCMGGISQKLILVPSVFLSYLNYYYLYVRSDYKHNQKLNI